MDSPISVYIPGFSRYKELYKINSMSKLATQSDVLTYCMLITDVTKLFTREDVHEFILRLALIFRHRQVLENFFRNEILLEFREYEKYVLLLPEDIKHHIGMQIADFPRDPKPRGLWVQQMKNEQQGSSIDDELMNFVDYERDGPEFSSTDEPQTPWFAEGNLPSPEDIKNAGILADCILADIDKKHFVRFKEENKGFLKMLESYGENVRSKPLFVFDWDGYSATVKQQLYKRLFPYRFKGSVERKKIPNAYAQSVVYVAWLYANGLVWDQERFIIDPRYKHPRNDLISMAYGITSNMNALYYTYNMGSVMEILKVKEN